MLWSSTLLMQVVRKGDTHPHPLTFDNGLHESLVVLTVNVVQSNEQLRGSDWTDAVNLVTYEIITVLCALYMVRFNQLSKLDTSPPRGPFSVDVTLKSWLEMRPFMCTWNFTFERDE